MGRWNLTPTSKEGVFRRDDGRLVVRVTGTHPATGKRLDRSRLCPPGTTTRDAVGRREELRREILGETSIRIPSVLNYAADVWIRRKLTRGDWRAGGMTLGSVKSCFRRHVMPTLGEVTLDRLTTAMLQAWMDQKVQAGYKPTSVSRWWTYLKCMVDDGCIEYGLQTPTTGIRPPRIPPRDDQAQVLMPEEIKRLKDTAAEHEPLWWPVLVLGFATGARPGELLAPHAGDLDLAGEIGIWTVSRHYGGRRRIIEGTKTGRTRKAYLDPASTSELRNHWQARMCEGPEAWLFPGQMVGPRDTDGPLSREGFHVALRRLCDRAGLRRVSAKVFRKTYATLGHLYSVPPAILQAQLGANPQTQAKHYIQAPDAQREAAARAWGNLRVVPDENE